MAFAALSALAAGFWRVDAIVKPAPGQNQNGLRHREELLRRVPASARTRLPLADLVHLWLA